MCKISYNQKFTHHNTSQTLSHNIRSITQQFIYQLYCTIVSKHSFHSCCSELYIPFCDEISQFNLVLPISLVILLNIIYIRMYLKKIQHKHKVNLIPLFYPFSLSETQIVNSLHSYELFRQLLHSRTRVQIPQSAINSINNLCYD